MKVIELQGHPGSGKSTTMRILYGMLLQNGFVRLGNPLATPGHDFAVVLERDRVKYGFMTFGDVIKHSVYFLKEFDEKHKCEWTICASRKFKTWSIKDSYPDSPHHIWKHPAPEGSSHLTVLEQNITDASRLFALLP